MKMGTELPRALPLAANDRRAIDALLQRSSAGQHERYLSGKSSPELNFYLDGSLGSTHGIFERGELVAMARLRIPSAEHPNRGAPLPRVPAADWPLHTAILEDDLVAATDRDGACERALLDARFGRAASASMRWVCAEVQLRNVASWRNMLAMGMVITGIRNIDGLNQLVLLRPLDGSALQTSPVDSTWAWVIAQDAPGHVNALEAGYLGVRQVFGGTVLYQPSVE